MRTVPGFACAAALLCVCPALPAQEPVLPSAAFMAVSTSAIGVTGDIRTAPGKLMLVGRPFTLRLDHAYTGDDLQHAAQMFSQDLTPDTTAALYRVWIPGYLKLAHGNTLCGSAATTFVVLLQKGLDLEIANFSGKDTPDLDPKVLGNSTRLCGTMGYTRK